MRALAIVLLLSSVAVADPDVKVVWFEHLTGKDGAMTTRSTITLTGTKVHYESSYEGPHPEKPRNKPKNVDGELKDPKAFKEALAAFDKTKASGVKLEPAGDHDDQTGCLTRGKTTRCEALRGSDKASPAYKALSDVTELLIDSVKLN